MGAQRAMWSSPRGQRVRALPPSFSSLLCFFPFWQKRKGRAGPMDLAGKLREAFESDYVSEHLHLWLDMCFGVGQDEHSVHCEKSSVFFLPCCVGSHFIVRAPCPPPLWATQTPTSSTRELPPRRWSAKSPSWKSLLAVSLPIPSSANRTPRGSPARST